MRVYFIYHLNLCFSSVEENERKDIINKCYWPLLNIIEKYNVKIGIEATAYTLETVSKIDKKFIQKLKLLIKNKKCEFIGSGYSQIIGPLAPYKINLNNLKIGNKIYKKLLNTHPKTALINEQVFSRGILDAYYECKYRNVIIDWDNAFKAKNTINENSIFYPHQTLSLSNKKINLIWSSSIFFQKFQRYIHSEISLNDYFDFINFKLRKNKVTSLCLYSSDIETINYRTNRYKSEISLKNNEWNKFEKLIEKLRKNKIQIIFPSDTLKLKKSKNKKKLIKFDNPEMPTITKKQFKYNITRWSSTGRNDNYINSVCWKIYNKIIKRKISRYANWKELCYLWSSDFRTHITNKRWNKYLIKINEIKKRYLINNKRLIFKKKHKKIQNISIQNYENIIQIKGSNIELKINTNKGCSIEKFIDHRVSKEFLFGFVPHGYFNDILYGVDFYSGHMVIEPLGSHKITDLNKPKINIEEKKDTVIVNCIFNIEKGKIFKKIIFDNLNNKVGIYYKIDIPKNINGSVRLNYITLNPKNFKKNLFFETNCGGKFKEKFFIKDKNFDHGSPVSHLISANQALGLTENIINIGDKNKSLNVEIDRDFDNQIGLISFKKIKNKNFFRLYFSLKEHDDTTKNLKKIKNETLIWIKIKSKK